MAGVAAPANFLKLSPVPVRPALSGTGDLNTKPMRNGGGGPARIAEAAKIKKRVYVKQGQ